MPEPETGRRGRYAPSPTGDLHIGNLRTALYAWLFAKATGREFLIRVEDIDQQRAKDPSSQLRDLAIMGVTSDLTVVKQSDRIDHYRQIITELSAAELTYECFCSRKDIREAGSAPHAPLGGYMGTCRTLSTRQREQRKLTRQAALRIKSPQTEFSVVDQNYGEVRAQLDDFVLQRNDGSIAYNLAVVVDDAESGVDQIVRGADLLSSSPRQAWFTKLLGYPIASYAHVPLVLNSQGERLSKRDGAVSLSDLIQVGFSPQQVFEKILISMGFDPGQDFVLDSENDIGQLLKTFDLSGVPERASTPDFG